MFFLWGGKDSNELELGEAALLTTELKLGTCYNVTTGLEPGAFLKAFDGQLRIEDNSKGEKMYCCLGDGNGSYLQQVENSKCSLRNGSSFVIIDHDKKRFSSTNDCIPVDTGHVLSSCFMDLVVNLSKLKKRMVWKKSLHS